MENTFEHNKLLTQSLCLLLQTLYERCDRMRPTLFRLASDTMEDDSALTQILEANDELTLVVNAFKEQVGRNAGRERNRSEEETGIKGNGMVVPDRTLQLIPLCSALADPDSSGSCSSEEPQRD